MCDTFTVSEGRVLVTAKGQSFTLPESLIDWPASEKAKAELDAQERAKEQRAEEAVKAANQPSVPRQKITLTTKDLKREEVPGTTGPITVSFKMISNSIVVGMLVNGEGPFNFILDTGASITTIDPEIVEKAGVTVKNETINVVGVGGNPISAPLISIGTLALEGALVSNLEAVSTRIHHLYTSQLYGLIGQDFLNHFVMNLDTNAKTITLTPQTALPSEVSKSESAKKFDSNLAMAELRQAMVTMERNYYLLKSENGVPNLMVSELNRAKQQISSVKQQLRYQQTMLGATDSVNLPTTEREYIQAFKVCAPHFDLFIDHLLTLNRTLTSACNNMPADERLLSDLQRNRDKTELAMTEYQACLQKIPQ